MKINFTLIILLFITMAGKAQVVLPSVVNSGGSSGTVNSIHFEFNLGEAFTSTIANGSIVTQGILQPQFQQNTLPVTGLEFTAKRINTNQVLLNWSTVQEINNSGFYIERKREDETDFTTLTFISSRAAGGNSSSPLSYTYTDINGYTGKTLYRLRQVDIDQRFSFSPTKIVAGQDDGTVTIKAWPVPAVDNLNVKVTGIQHTEQLQVVDMQGRTLKKYVISNDQTITINGLPSGTYILRLSKDVPVIEKIVVQ